MKTFLRSLFAGVLLLRGCHPCPAANTPTVFSTDQLYGRALTNALVTYQPLSLITQSNRLIALIPFTNRTDSLGSFTNSFAPGNYRVTVSDTRGDTVFTNCIPETAGVAIFASDYICQARPTNGVAYNTAQSDARYLLKTNANGAAIHAGLSNVFIRPRFFSALGPTNATSLSNAVWTLTNTVSGEGEWRAISVAGDVTTAQLNTASNLLAVQITTLQGATNGLDARLTAQTNGLQGEINNLQGSTNGLDVKLTSQTNGFQTAIGNLQGSTNGLAAQITSASNYFQTNAVMVLARSGAALWASNGETIIFTNNLPANILGTNRTAHLVLDVDFLNNTAGSSNFTIKIWFGSAVVFNQATANLTQSANTHVGLMDIRASNLDSTASQSVSILLLGGLAAAPATGTGGISGAATSGFPASGVGRGTATADSTATIPFAVTVTTAAVAPATYFCKMVHATLVVE